MRLTVGLVVALLGHGAIGVGLSRLPHGRAAAVEVPVEIDLVPARPLPVAEAAPGPEAPAPSRRVVRRAPHHLAVVTATRPVASDEAPALAAPAVARSPAAA